MKKVILTLILGLSIISFTEPLRKTGVTGNAKKEVIPDIAKISFRTYTKNDSENKSFCYFEINKIAQLQIY